jgi:rhamnose utilization protein RhaD (predicted bifunctional aldolase and dehydrogenase)
MEGNVSKKTNFGLTIKASGAKLNEIKPNDFVDYDLMGNQLNNFNKKGSIEIGLHLYLLKNFNISYISHTHPVNTVKILCSDKAEEFSSKRFFPDQVVFNGTESCLVPYGRPGNELTDILKISLGEFINKNNYFPKLILLKNHGIITCGKTIDECLISGDICEKSAEIFTNPFKINYFTDSEINDILNDKNEQYRINKL